MAAVMVCQHSKKRSGDSHYQDTDISRLQMSGVLILLLASTGYSLALAWQRTWAQRTSLTLQASKIPPQIYLRPFEKLRQKVSMR